MSVQLAVIDKDALSNSKQPNSNEEPEKEILISQEVKPIDQPPILWG
jgi:hypothetical protein